MMFSDEPSFEEKYQDVLQNIEFSIAKIYQNHPEMTDYDVDRTLNALIREYKAEQRGRELKVKLRNELREELYSSINMMCLLRLGQIELGEEDEENVPQLDISSISVAELVDCLKRVQKSVSTWNKEGGQQGYLQFISQFLG